MNALGLSVLRTWAFNDASSPKTWQGLQLQPGVFNETVLRYASVHSHPSKSFCRA